jgi:hypothetical protein
MIYLRIKVNAALFARFTSLWAGQYDCRKKSPAEVARVLQEIDSEFVIFWDDDLLLKPRYTEQLCEAVKPLKKKGMSQMGATYVARGPNLLKSLAESGCTAMFMVLSPSTRSP